MPRPLTTTATTAYLAITAAALVFAGLQPRHATLAEQHAVQLSQGLWSADTAMPAAANHPRRTGGTR